MKIAREVPAEMAYVEPWPHACPTEIYVEKRKMWLHAGKVLREHAPEVRKDSHAWRLHQVELLRLRQAHYYGSKTGLPYPYRLPSDGLETR